MNRSPNALRAPIALTLTVALAVACSPGPGPGEEPAELEIVDVEPVETLDVDLSEDRRAAPRREGGGRLPSDYPSGLPVFQPSTIADIEQHEEGGSVQFRARSDEGTVKAWYLTSLEAAGWSVQTGPGGILLAERGGVAARITIDQPGPVTVVVVEY